ncbi:DUF4296 domain-containing protein [Pedobacter sp. L105]|uniref:DUF4296 domain-containing protein n=1 Tax=Pedobacter sp. L105 TaxID=1641871 RepID=UPI00131DBDBA|nr:DUF4296 domain-containing protein [Pedobacter sp. L105]
MRRFCWVGLLFIVIGGCKPKIPENIIHPSRMGVILYDIHVVDGYIASIPKQDSAKKVSAAFYKGVYRKFSIDSAIFTRSMNYYYDHPDVLSNIYDRVTTSLKKSKDSVDKIQRKIMLKAEALQKKKRDSIEKANPKMAAAKAEAVQKLKKDSIAKVAASLNPVNKVKKDNAPDPTLDKAMSKRQMPKGAPGQGALKN